MTARRRPVELWVDDVLASGLPASAKLVALVMARFADWYTLRGVWVSPTRLAELTGLSVPTVKRMLRLLRCHGVIEQTVKGGAPHRTSTYRGVSPRDTTNASGVSPRADWRITTREVAYQGDTQSLHGAPSVSDMKRRRSARSNPSPPEGAPGSPAPRRKRKSLKGYDEHATAAELAKMPTVAPLSDYKPKDWA